MNTKTDPVDAEIDEQIFGGCYGILVWFFLVSGGLIIGTYVIIFNVFL